MREVFLNEEKDEKCYRIILGSLVILPILGFLIFDIYGFLLGLIGFLLLDSLMPRWLMGASFNDLKTIIHKCAIRGGSDTVQKIELNGFKIYIYKHNYEKNVAIGIGLMASEWESQLSASDITAFKEKHNCFTVIDHKITYFYTLNQSKGTEKSIKILLNLMKRIDKNIKASDQPIAELKVRINPFKSLGVAVEQERGLLFNSINRMKEKWFQKDEVALENNGIQQEQDLDEVANVGSMFNLVDENYLEEQAALNAYLKAEAEKEKQKLKEEAEKTKFEVVHSGSSSFLLRTQDQTLNLNLDSKYEKTIDLNLDSRDHIEFDFDEIKNVISKKKDEES